MVNNILDAKAAPNTSLLTHEVPVQVTNFMVGTQQPGHAMHEVQNSTPLANYLVPLACCFSAHGNSKSEAIAASKTEVCCVVEEKQLLTHEVPVEVTDFMVSAQQPSDAMHEAQIQRTPCTVPCPACHLLHNT
jgi:hypothetical protein